MQEFESEHDRLGNAKGVNACAMGYLIGLHNLPKVGRLPLLDKVELPEMFRCLVENPCHPVNPVLGHQHTLQVDARLYNLLSCSAVSSAFYS